MSLTFGSLFAGIGGFDLGLERAGLTCRWQVEIDPFCTRVLTKHWPDVPKYRDVRDVGAHNLERVDVICGGFPCQDISSAGNGDGIDGARSGLWREYARVVGELRPRVVLVENVSALLVRGLGRVLGDLAEIGYDAEWECLPAAAFGADHVRDRVWIVAYTDSRGRQIFGQSKPRRVERESRRFPDRRCGVWQFDNLPKSCGAWTTESGMGRVATGVSNRVDRLRGLGNAAVPQVCEWIGRRLIESDSCSPPRVSRAGAPQE